MRAPPRRSLEGVLVALAVSGLLVWVLAVSAGAVAVPLGTVWRVVAGHAGLGSGAGSRVQEQIVWDVRMPRVLLGFVVGAGLAIAGVVIQALVRNPLGDPYLLGGVPGASLGAVTVIVAGGILGSSISAAAFVGAMTAFVFTFVLGREGGRFPPARLILAGVAVGYLFSSATYFLQTRATPNQVQRVLFWQLGSLAGARWSDLAIPAVTVVLTLAFVCTRGSRLNALVVGEDAAATLGIDVGRFRLVLMLVASLLTGVVVAVAGGIGFIGLMIPHLARTVVGSDHRRVLPVAALGGGVFLMGADVVARTALAPAELPVGVVTAACGAPFLLWLLRRTRAGAAVQAAPS
ncbi:MAG: iron ABC transporter permease [Ilumatobacteraceae bacterium]